MYPENYQAPQYNQGPPPPIYQMPPPQNPYNPPTQQPMYPVQPQVVGQPNIVIQNQNANDYGGMDCSHELHDYAYKKSLIKVILGILICCQTFAIFSLLFSFFVTLGWYNEFTSYSSGYITGMLIYIVVCFFFNLANLFVNWKLYETISNHCHEEARKWLKMQITLVAINLVVAFIFQAALG